MSLMTTVGGNTTSFKSNNNNKINDIINEDSSTTKNNTQCALKFLKSANLWSVKPFSDDGEIRYPKPEFRALEVPWRNGLKAC